MLKSRILVCGGRNFKDQRLFDSVMEYSRQFRSDYFCIIHGHARGADTIANDWALSKGVPVFSMPANWEAYPRMGGFLRNTWLLDFALPDVVIAFPGGHGTTNMIAQAADRGLDIYDVSEHLDDFL